MKTIKINDVEYKFNVGFGVMMDFEDQNDKQITKIKSLKDISSLIFITLKYNNEHFTISKKEFIDEILDKNHWLIEEITNLLFTPKNDEKKS
jgi:hypothetical protein